MDPDRLRPSATILAALADFTSDYQVLFDLSPLSSYVVDDETQCVLAVNQAAVRRYGYELEAFLRLTVEDLRPADERPRFRAAIEQHASDRLYFGRWTHVSSTGDCFTVDIASQALTFHGRAAHLVTASHIAERQAVQNASVLDEHRLQALIDGALDAILVWNDDAQLVDANLAACALVGVDRTRLLAMKIWDLVPPEDRDQLDEQWRQFHADGRLSGQLRVRQPLGDARTVEFRAAANFVPGMHFAILRDLAEMGRLAIAAEERIRESHEQLRRISARGRARREQDRLRIARELHDQLGQQLAALKIGLHGLDERLTDRSSSLDDHHDKLTMMSHLVDQMVVSMRRIASELRPPALDKLGLQAAIEWYLREFQRGGIRTTLQLLGRPLTLDIGRSTLVFRIFQEALSNVEKHAHASRVRVTLRLSRVGMTLVVSDNGVGVRPHLTMSNDSLGLAGMHERAVALGGTVDVRRGSKLGTTVTLRFPIADRRAAPRNEWP